MNLEHEKSLPYSFTYRSSEYFIFPRFQGIYSTDEKLIAYEILSKVRDSNGCIVDPEDFFIDLPSGLTDNILRWQLNLSFNVMIAEDIKFFINVSSNFIASQNFTSMLLDIPHNFREKVVFELTQPLQKKTQRDKINSLAKRGFCFYVDDLGGNGPSFDAIYQLSIKGIKIDRLFFLRLIRDDLSLLFSIVSYFKKKEMYIIIEGIENEDELNICKSLQVDAVQGYLLCRGIAYRCLSN